jgi:hypothetical protein
MKKGISLIALVITMIIIIILAGAVILSLVNSNSIYSANKAQFLSDVAVFKNELVLYEVNKLSSSSGSYKFETLNANKTKIEENGVVDTTKNIADIITSIKGTRYLDIFEIKEGVIVYTGLSDDEITWCRETDLTIFGGVFLNVSTSINEVEKSLTVDINSVDSNNNPIADVSKIDSYNLYISETNSFDTVTPVVLPGNTSSTSYTKTDIALDTEYFIKADMTMNSKTFSSQIESAMVNTVQGGIVALVKNNDIQDGIYQITTNNKSYQVEVYNFYDDVEYMTSPVLGNNTADQSMLVLKYHKNLIIDSGVTMIPQVRKKGMYIYVGGTLTNGGTISMTARGANAVGEDVYLWKNEDATYEYVPAVGATGGLATVAPNNGYNGSVNYAGKAGVNGTNRKTGGGGSGAAACNVTGTGVSGRGGNGTSYSGGSGGGAAIKRSTGTSYAGNGSDTGGAGGAAFSSRYSSWYTSGGGAGNPGGLGKHYSTASLDVNYSGQNGTGGLLIIFAKTLLNNNSIVSNGSAGGGGTAGGGSSGGGSINIFTVDDFVQIGTITSTGPITGNGGAGGKGSITTTKVSL